MRITKSRMGNGIWIGSDDGSGEEDCVFIHGTDEHHCTLCGKTGPTACIDSSAWEYAGTHICAKCLTVIASLVCAVGSGDGQRA